MEESIIQRIKSYLSINNISNRSLALQLGMSEKTLNNKLNGTRGLDTDTLQKIALQFEALNTDWLLTGRGNMERVCQQIGDLSNSSAIGNNVNGSGNSISHNDLSEVVDLQKKYILIMQKKDEQIDRLLGIIEKLSK